MEKHCAISKKSECLYTFIITYGTVLAVFIAMLLISCQSLDENLLSNTAWMLDGLVDGFVPTTITFVAVLLLQQFLRGSKFKKNTMWFVIMLTSIIAYSILYIAAKAMTEDVHIIALDSVMVVLTIVEMAISKRMVSVVFSDDTYREKAVTSSKISG